MGGGYSGSSSGPHSARPFVPELLATFRVHVWGTRQSAKCLLCIVLKKKQTHLHVT